MRRYMPLLAAAALALSTTAGYADLGDQLFKLLPDDGAASDGFGHSVSISGATAIGGSYVDDDACPEDPGCNSGSAYIFDATSGQQLAKLLPDDGAEGDQFGASVAISGTIAIVGARYDDDKGDYSGSAYLFNISDPANWTQIAKLLPDDGAFHDFFGESVAISGDIAIVGANGNDDACPEYLQCNSGSAYLFDTATGQQIAKLLPNEIAEGDDFGWSVAISGVTAIVGAPMNLAAGPSSIGSAYLFDTTTGQQIAELLPDDSVEGDTFGWSVAIDGIIAIVGARRDDDNGTSSGSAYLFDVTTGQQIAKMLPDDGAAYDHFGWSVAITGTTAIVGAQFDNDNGTWSGSAYLFDISDPANWTQVAKLLPDDGAEEDFFGRSVAMSGATAIVAAYFDDDNGYNSGSAYLFDAAEAPACPWDFDGDGNVGASDLAVLLGSWGPCDACPADLDGDDDVDAADLALVLGNWGPCP